MSDVTPAEIWAIPEPSDEMIWNVCPYTRGIGNVGDGCNRCPEWEPDEHYGKVQRMCRMLAAEACRVMLALQRRDRRSPAPSEP